MALYRPALAYVIIHYIFKIFVIYDILKITWNLQVYIFVLQHTGLRGSIDPLLEEADIDKDGKISLSEFRKLLRTASMGTRNVNSPAAHRGSRRQ